MYFLDIDFGSDLAELGESSVGGVDGSVSETTVTPPHPTSVGSDFGSASSLRQSPSKPRPETIDLGGYDGGPHLKSRPPIDLEAPWDRPEGDGVSDFTLEERKAFEADRRAEADSGFGTFRLKAFMSGGSLKQDWVVPGWIPRGELCIFAAERGLGKTALLMQMLLSISTGQPFIGIPVESGIVVGLFHEDPSVHIRGRYSALFEEEATDLDQLDDSDRLRFETRDYDKGSEDRRVLWNGGPTANFHDLERKIAAIGNVRLLVIDTIKRVLAGDVDKGENVRHFLSALQGLADRQNIAIVTTTHLNREKKTAGSSELENQGRSVFHLVKNGNGGMQATLTSVKLNCGPEPSPIPLEKSMSSFWRVRSETVRLPARADASVDAKDRGERLRAILFDVIDNHPKGLFVSKQTKLYAPRVAADTPAAQRLRALPNEFEVVLTNALRAGEIVEERKDSRHSTMVLRVAD